LGKRKEQLIQILIAIIAFIVASLTLIIILPISAISYVYTQLKIKSRTLRKKLKDIL